MKTLKELDSIIMESSKRSRPDSKGHNEMKSLRKRVKSMSGGKGKDSPVSALLFDNGGYTIKIGYNTDQNPISLPNCIMKAKSERKRVFVADQIEDCRNLSGLYYMYPHEKGYITKFDIQKNIWDYTFNKFPIDDHTVMLTQPIYNFKTIQEYTDEIFFEEYDVKSLFKANASDYCFYNYVKQFKETTLSHTSGIVIDSGFNFTHIVPYIKGKKFAEGIIRINLGGKLLTNYLKDIISYRQLHVMEETYVINQVKEDVCFTAENFKADMKRSKATNDIVKNYVLPDFHTIRRGYIQDNVTAELAENCQILKLNNERITIPEIMFRPSIIPGFEFAGLAESIGHALKRCPKEFQSQMTQNVILCGGNTVFPGFRDRLETDTRIYLPCEYELKIFQPDDPINYAWFGGKRMSGDSSFRKKCVTKHQYEEEGSSYLYDKFNVFYKADKAAPKKETDTSEGFSYLNYWKKEGVDIFQKKPLTPLKNPEIQFKLEGENIEEYDGKFVSLDFEIEKPEEESPKYEEVPVTSAEESAKSQRKKRFLQIQTPQTQTSMIITPPSLQPITQKVITTPIATSIRQTTPSITTVTTATTNRTVTTLTSLPPHLLKAVGKMAKAGQIVTISPQMLQQARLGNPNILNNNIILPKLTRIQPRVIRPLYKTVQPTTAVVSTQQGKITQYISLGNNVSLNMASTSAGAAKTVIAPSLLNNAVIVPQNMLTSKNLTFQIIPIKPGQGNIILTKAKSTKD